MQLEVLSNLICAILVPADFSLFLCPNLTCFFSAGVFVKLNKPNAAIRDANEALQVDISLHLFFYRLPKEVFV